MAFENSQNIVTNGLNIDDNPQFVQNGDYTYALNLSKTNKENNEIGQNYEGNAYCTELDTGFLELSHLRLLNDDILIFAVNPTDVDSQGRCNSEIGILSNCTYTKVARSYCLNFRIDKPISSVFKQQYDQSIVVYWTDFYNPRRYLNLSKVPYIQINSDSCNPIYGTDLDCNKILIDRNLNVPCITINQVLDSGGDILSGSYQFAIQYTDSYGTGLTDYYSLTGYIPIYRDALNGNTWNGVWGSQPSTITSKSIQLSFGNLDNGFTNFNLAVIKTINNVQSAQIVANLPTSQSSYIYTGTVVSDITVDEVVKQSTIYELFKTVADANGYLEWGNMVGKKDYNYQPYANQIQVTYQTYRIKASNLQRDYKNPVSTATRMSLMRDEVYALGIVFTYNDGSESPVYHIPGRQKNKKSDGTFITNILDQYGNTINGSGAAWDMDMVAAGDDNYDNQSERWKVFNTSTYEGSDTLDSNGEGWHAYGQMAYWESTNTYPNNPAVWGNLCGKPIRHHKMPDCSWTYTHIHDRDDKYTLIVNDSTNTNYDANMSHSTYISLLGIKVTNINIPLDLQSKIQGWKIVAGDRHGNETVIAKGLTFNCRQEDPTGNENGSNVRCFPNYPYNYITSDTHPATNTHKDPYYDHTKLESTFNFNNYFTFHSPDAGFLKKQLSCSELKRESYEIGSSYQNQSTITDYSLMSHLVGDQLYGSFSYGTYNYFEKPSYTNIKRRLINSVYAPANSVVGAIGGLQFALNNIHRESSVFLGVSQPNYSFAYYPSSTTFFDYSLQNAGNDSPPSTSNTNYYFSISSYYCSLKNPSYSIYGNVDTINYLGNGNCLSQKNPSISDTFRFLLGDTFITQFSTRRHHGFFNNYDSQDYNTFDNTNFNIPFLNFYKGNSFGGVTFMYYHSVPVFWCESSINTELRYSGGTPETDFWGNATSIGTWLNQSIITNPNFINVDQAYLYDISYSHKFDDINYTTQLANFDPNTPNEWFFSRVIYSEPLNIEGLSDNWLIYKPNNFYDFPKNRGQLWSMHSIGQDKVMYNFEETTYIYYAYATMEADTTTVEIGTGSLFQKPPRELVTVEGGYVGTRSSSFNSNPYGYFLIDDKRKKIFQIGDKATEISRNKMYTWFNDNLKLNLIEQFPDINPDTSTNPQGIGFTMGFDNNTRLLFITKRDYQLKNEWIGKVFYDTSISSFRKNRSEGYTIISVQDPNYFINKSWTISYDPEINRWKSFYSFIPNDYIQTYNGYKTSLNTTYDELIRGTSFWTHGTIPYHTYYTKSYPHILELSILNSKSPITKLNNIEWKTYCYETINNTLYEHKNITFDKAIVYNSEQCSGNLNLVVKNPLDLSIINNLPNIGTQVVNIPIFKADTWWSMNYLWDTLADRNSSVPIFTANWNNINYQTEYPIDKSLNNIAINYNKAFWELKPFKNSWNKVRFYYNNNNYKLISAYFDTQKRASIR